MARRYPSKEAREIIIAAQTIGWRVVGTTGRGHPLLQHENGKKYSISATPGDHRNRANSLAMLQKLADQRIETTVKKRKKAS